jgi:hypothetical protein
MAAWQVVTETFELRGEAIIFKICFKFSYINNTMGFHCDNSTHAYSIPWARSPPLLQSYSPSPTSLLFQTVEKQSLLACALLLQHPLGGVAEHKEPAQW